MVVPEDHGRRIVGERALDDLARIDGRAVDRAAEQLLVADQPVPRVEEQAAEHLVRQVEQPRLEKARRVVGRRERAARLERCAEIAPAELERGRETRDARGAQALRARQLGRSATEQRRQAAPFAEQRTRELGGRLAARARAEQDREQLAIRQGLGPASSSRSRGRSDGGQRLCFMELLRPRTRAFIVARTRRLQAAAISPRRHKKSSISQWHGAKNRG